MTLQELHCLLQYIPTPEIRNINSTKKILTIQEHKPPVQPTQIDVDDTIHSLLTQDTQLVTVGREPEGEQH